MAGKQAKILNDKQLAQLLAYASTTRYPLRNRVIVLLSVKAGLRAGEIAKLTWDMVLDPSGQVSAAQNRSFDTNYTCAIDAYL
jgi:integrase/recombinase XerD